MDPLQMMVHEKQAIGGVSKIMEQRRCMFEKQG
jgi:hypothetical protein